MRQRNGSHRLEHGHGRRGNQLRRSLMRKMAIRAARVIGRAVAIEVGDDNCGEHQQREERQGNSEDADGPAHSVSGEARRMTNPLNSNWMWDVRKALPVTSGAECNSGMGLGRAPCAGALAACKPGRPKPVLRGLLQGSFEDGQALLGALAQRVVPVARILLARMEFVGNRHGRQHGDAD